MTTMKYYWYLNCSVELSQVLVEKSHCLSMQLFVVLKTTDTIMLLYPNTYESLKMVDIVNEILLFYPLN